MNKPNFNQAKEYIQQLLASSEDDFFTEALRVLDQQKIPDVFVKLTEGVAIFETRTGIDMRYYLKFGKKGSAHIKYHKNGDYHFIGELNATNRQHGRCIIIDSDWIAMSHYKESGDAVGNYLAVSSWGEIEVGEILAADSNGEVKWNGTVYNVDGSTEKFD